MSEKMVVAICGVIGSGKNTLAKAFEYSSFESVSFASALKDAVAAIFGWDRALLEGDTKESRIFRDTVDEFWTKKLGQSITPRFVLQNFGTDVLRKYLHDNIWIFSLEKKISQSKSNNIIITDCRFPNEIEMIRRYNGTIIEIQKELPEWYQYCLEYNFDSSGKESPSKKYGIHSSEYSWIGVNKPDYYVQNNGTVPELVQKGYDIIQKLNSKG